MNATPSSNPLDSIANALKALLLDGLPARADVVDRRLLDLRGVIARSSDPGDDLSRLSALNRLLDQQIKRIPFYKQRDLARSAYVLFGRAKVSQRLDLTRRYEAAAKVAAYNRDHFRQKIVPMILWQLATQLHQDSANYTGRTRAAVEITGDGPSLDESHLSSREVTLHEEHLSRLWEYVYGLRAEHLAVLRLEEWPDAEHTVLKLEEARQSMLWYIARLQVSVHSYIDTYGETVAKGQTEFNAEGLMRIAGWTGELPPETAHKVRLLAIREPTKEGFLRAAKKAQLVIPGAGN